MFTEEQALGYLAGLIDGEGYVDGKHKLIYIGATDVEMIKAGAECCKILGLHCTEYQPREYRPGNRKQMYDLRIRTRESLQRIANDVPLQIPRKREALHVALSGFKRPPKPSREWLYQKYVEEGLTGPQIGEIVGCSFTRVYNWLREYRIPIKQGPIAVRRSRPDKDWFIEQYVNRKRTVKDIAAGLGVANTTVYKWLDDYDIARPRHVNQQ